MIKAIVFDLGGVLVNLDLDICISTFRSVLGYDSITEILDHTIRRASIPTSRRGFSPRTDSVQRYLKAPAREAGRRMWTGAWSPC